MSRSICNADLQNGNPVLETELAAFEESVFLNIAETRSSEEAFEGTASARLEPESMGEN